MFACVRLDLRIGIVASGWCVTVCHGWSLFPFRDMEVTHARTCTQNWQLFLAACELDAMIHDIVLGKPNL